RRRRSCRPRCTPRTSAPPPSYPPPSPPTAWRRSAPGLPSSRRKATRISCHTSFKDDECRARKSTASRPGVLGLLLAEERHDADRGVRGQGGAGEVLGLDVQRIVQAQVVPTPDRVLDHGDGDRGGFGQPAGELADRTVQLLGP